MRLDDLGISKQIKAELEAAKNENPHALEIRLRNEVVKMYCNGAIRIYESV